MNDIEMERQRKQAAGGRRRKGLSVFRLKTIAAVFMALSVASTTLVPLLVGPPTADNMTGLTVAVVCEVASWCAVPIYAWLLVNGLNHTRSVPRYALRLLVLAVVCEAPYMRLMTGHWFDMRAHNPVWGLLVALVVLVAADWIAKRYAGAPRVLLTVAVVAAGVLWDLLLRVGVSQQVMYTGVLTLAFALVFRYLGAHENTMMFTAGLLGAVMCITPGVGVAFLHYRNDEPGWRHAWTQWVFYALYPIMLVAGCLMLG
ncbi:TraX family protein [Bifidobacterium saguinibicoloris]|uniref:TraX family protein n=1 Tax=Bifidobacterium saguinibicoloris TaxID=2834433 RepID=UPI001C562171|nr:TraX family protein [Bifidobacterium saguinibicoloris]MBW3081317.1 ABC transporter permease [Bifidobacterium saguinibicoloris]